MSLGTKMAIAAATGSTLNQIGNDDEDVKDEDTGPGMKSYGIHGLSIVGFGSAIASMFMISGIWVGFTSLFTIALSPLAVWQRVQLDSLGGMRGQQNALRQKVNNLTSENNKLTSSIDDFEQQVEKYVCTMMCMCDVCVSRVGSLCCVGSFSFPLSLSHIHIIHQKHTHNFFRYPCTTQTNKQTHTNKFETCGRRIGWHYQYSGRTSGSYCYYCS